MRAPSAGIALLAVILAVSGASELAPLTVRPGYLTLGLVLLAFAGGLACSALEIRRAWRTSWEPLALLAITAGAVALRFSLSPRTILHEGYHADYIDHFLNVRDVPVLYGDAGPAIYLLASAFTGRGADAVFLGNAVLAGLTAGVVGLLDLALFGRWPRALLAAVVVAILPLHLRFSAAEDLSIPFTFCLAWACAAAARWARTGSTAALYATACATALAVQCRPEAIVAPLVVGGLVVALGEGRRLLSKDGITLGISVILLCLGHVLALATRLPKNGPPLEIRWSTPWAVAFARLDLTPIALLVLVVLGLVAGLRRDWRVHAWILAGIALFLGISHYLLLDYPRFNFRSQVVLAPFVALLAGSALDLVKGRLTWAAAAVAAVTLAYGLLGRVGAIREVGDQQEEFAFLRESAGKRPENCTILTIAGSGKDIIDAFPTFLARPRRCTLVDVARAAATNAWPEPAENTLYYEGMGCHTAGPAKPTGALAPVCRAVHERYDLVPVEVHEVVSEPYNSLTYLEKPWNVGWFRVVGRH